MAAATPRGGRGAIIMFHDGGGNRSQTVAALRPGDHPAAARGYRFTTVTGGLRLAAGDVPATSRQRLVGEALVLTQQAADRTVTVLAVLLLIASVLTVVTAALLSASPGRTPPDRAGVGQPPHPGPGSCRTSRSSSPPTTRQRASRPRVRSMIARPTGPARDHRRRRRLRPTTPPRSSRGLGLPDVRVIRQPNAGKPTALNSGIAEARSEILVLVDGDTVFQPDTVGELVAPLRRPARRRGRGNAKVGNRRGLLGRWQHIEYVMGFNLDRRLFDLLGTHPDGARRDRRLPPRGAGRGRRHPDDTLAEDTDVTMALCRAGWRVVYEPDAIAWTEAPTTLRQLWRQRYRWSLRHHAGDVEAPARGHRARPVRPVRPRAASATCSFFQVLLPLIAPVVDVFSLYGLIFLNPVDGRGCLVRVHRGAGAGRGYALRLDGERLRPLWALPLQQVVYRQLMYLVTIQSVMTAMLGTRHRWQAIRRRAFFASHPAGDAPAAEPASAAIPRQVRKKLPGQRARPAGRQRRLHRPAHARPRLRRVRTARWHKPRHGKRCWPRSWPRSRAGIEPLARAWTSPSATPCVAALASGGATAARIRREPGARAGVRHAAPLGRRHAGQPGPAERPGQRPGGARRQPSAGWTRATCAARTCAPGRDLARRVTGDGARRGAGGEGRPARAGCRCAPPAGPAADAHLQHAEQNLDRMFADADGRIGRGHPGPRYRNCCDPQRGAAFVWMDAPYAWDRASTASPSPRRTRRTRWAARPRMTRKGRPPRGATWLRTLAWKDGTATSGPGRDQACRCTR